MSAWTKHGSYVSSKWAVRGLTKVAALELAADGIRVNGVFPGPIATPMMIRDDDSDALERLSNTPLGRVGKPEDIAEAVLFLVSDRSAFITGCELTIDGGQDVGTIFTRVQNGCDRPSRPVHFRIRCQCQPRWYGF